MAITSRAIMAFFVEFERSISLQAEPGVMQPKQRDPLELIKLFQSYSNCTIHPLYGDFAVGLHGQDAANERANIDQPSAIWSLVLNFGARAEIYINDQRRSDERWLVNHCHRRFLLLKEAFHVILRDEFIRNGTGHPDTGTAEKLVTLTEALVYLPFSIVDFDSLEYIDGVKVEHAAELLAFLMLYPFDALANDRKAFLQLAGNGPATFEQPEVILADTLQYAEEFMVPQRYVDLLFRWQQFEQLYLVYRQLRDGHTAF